MVERLGNEVVRPGLDRLRLLGTDARRDHDHRQDRRVLVFAQLLADRVTVHPGHDNVEQDQIGLLSLDELERLRPAMSRDDLVAPRSEHRLEQPHVLREVVDDEDLGRAVAAIQRSLRSSA